MGIRSLLSAIYLGYTVPLFMCCARSGIRTRYLTTERIPSSWHHRCNCIRACTAITLHPCCTRKQESAVMDHPQGNSPRGLQAAGECLSTTSLPLPLRPSGRLVARTQGIPCGDGDGGSGWWKYDADGPSDTRAAGLRRCAFALALLCIVHYSSCIIIFIVVQWRECTLYRSSTLLTAAQGAVSPSEVRLPYRGQFMSSFCMEVRMILSHVQIFRAAQIAFSLAP